MPQKHVHRKAFPKLSPAVKELIAEIALEFPAFGVRGLAGVISGRGIKISEKKLYSVLRDQGLNNSELRHKRLEERHLSEGLVLTELQRQALHDFNPCLRERNLEARQPGQILIQDAVDLGKLRPIGQLILHAVVDPCCCLAFAAFSDASDPAASIAVLNDQALAFYRQEKIPVQAVLAGKGVVPAPGSGPAYEEFLKKMGLAFRPLPAEAPAVNGFILRFERAVRKNFLAEARRSKAFQDLKALQSGFAAWLERYNHKTPLFGYPTMGRPPMEAFRDAVPPRAAPEEVKPKPQPRTEPVSIFLPAVVPAPPASRTKRHHGWKVGSEIWIFRAVNLALVCFALYLGWTIARMMVDTTSLDGRKDLDAAVQAPPVQGTGGERHRAPPIEEYRVVGRRDLFAASGPVEPAKKREKIAVGQIRVAGKEVGLKLIGTVVADEPMMNYAVIDVSATRSQEIFRERDRIGKAVIKLILRNNVVIETDDGRRQRLTTEEEAPKGSTAPQAAPAPSPQPTPVPAKAKTSQEGEGTIQLSRNVIPSSPEAINSIVEELDKYTQNKKKMSDGISVGRVRAKDPFFKLGLRSGDVIKGINDHDLNSPEDIDYLFQELSRGGDFTLLVERRGQPQKLDLTIE